MRFQTPLEPAVLLRRHKRFLADIRLDDSREATAHCPNPGAMTGLAIPGTRIWVEPVTGPRRKLKFAWRLVEHGPGQFTCVDTGLPNRAVRAALEARALPQLGAYDRVLPEQPLGVGSRVDFLLKGAGLPDLWLEVKSVTLSRRAGLAEFPDSVTARGARHLGALADAARQGQRAALLYLVQRSDSAAVAVAHDIDPAYGAAHDAARAAGVAVLAYATHLSTQMITIAQPLPLR